MDITFYCKGNPSKTLDDGSLVWEAFPRPQGNENHQVSNKAAIKWADNPNTPMAVFTLPNLFHGAILDCGHSYYAFYLLLRISDKDVVRLEMQSKTLSDILRYGHIRDNQIHDDLVLSFSSNVYYIHPAHSPEGIMSVAIFNAKLEDSFTKHHLPLEGVIVDGNGKEFVCISTHNNRPAFIPLVPQRRFDTIDITKWVTYHKNLRGFVYRPLTEGEIQWATEMERLHFETL